MLDDDDELELLVVDMVVVDDEADDKVLELAIEKMRQPIEVEEDDFVDADVNE